MGVIEETYEDLDTDVSLEEFRAAVEDKVEQMGGLADEETAAMLIAHELQDEEVNSIADIAPGMDEVKFLGKVVSIGDLRTFERDDGDSEGRVVNVEVADETGRIRIALWDDLAIAAVGDPEDPSGGDLEEGDVLRIAGRPKDGFNGVEVNADRAEVDEDAAIDVTVSDTYRVEDLSLGLSDVTLQGRILDVDTVRTFSRDDGSEGKVANMTLGDPTGRVRLTLWDEMADLVEEYDQGDSIEIIDGYVRDRDGEIELHLGSRGAIESLSEPIEYVPESTPIEELEIGQTVDIAGGVIEVDPKRTFDRDDGSEGQVRNIRLKDDTGEIRVALWGEKADAEIDLADYVVCTDVEIQDGWQDPLEASAGWRSAVTVLDRDPAEPPTPDEGRSENGATDDERAMVGSDREQPSASANAGGLAAFGADTAAESGEPNGETATENASDTANSNTSLTETAAESGSDSDGATVEFTGTVVQSGSPIVLDNGSETKTVETDESVRLGENVTVRGREIDGTIDAEDVF